MSRKKGLVIGMVQASAVANLATEIPEAAKAALVASYVGSTDDVSRNQGFRTAVLKFGESLPAQFRDKALPEADAGKMADAAAAAFLASYGDLKGKTDDERKSVAKMVTQKRSRAFALFTAAPILPTIYAQGFSGTIQDTLKLCTALKANEYSVPKTLAAIEAQANAPKNYPASIAQHMASVLHMKADNVQALCPKAKAQLVEWLDFWQIKANHADDYRNPQLAQS
jgi:hypothetical protein